MKTLFGGLALFALSLPACGGSAPTPEQPVSPAPAPESQPIAKEEPASTPVAEGPSDDEEVEGVESGGVVGGVMGDELPPPPPPPAPGAPQVVPQIALESLRISGEKNIVPPDEVMLAMKRKQETRTVTTLKLCLSDAGEVDRVDVLKSSGYADYDALLQNTITTTWKYRPFLINGKAVPVCTSVTFIYNQRNDAP